MDPDAFVFDDDFVHAILIPNAPVRFERDPRLCLWCARLATLSDLKAINDDEELSVGSLYDDFGTLVFFLAIVEPPERGE